jgi:tRNA threonylcarbamoyladenosine biosynthesis protein TsaB
VLVLGIDTSDGVSVALLDAGDVVARADGSDPRRHAETLAPAIAWVLDEAGVRPQALGAVAVGTGPAPFTGLRVGLVTARTFARVLDIPAYGVCSLDALARQAFDDEALSRADTLVVVADARRREVYTAQYRRSTGAPEADVERLTEPAVASPAVLRAALDARFGASGGGLADAVAAGRVAVVGRGAHLYPAELGAAPRRPATVDAAVVARLGPRRAAHGGETDLEPRYLRRPDVSPPAARKRAS